MGDEDEEAKYELYIPGQDAPRAEMSKMYSGYGLAKYVTGDQYDGVFIEGYRRGKGVYSFKKNGDKYEGFYEENKKHGFGKMVYTKKTGDEEADAAAEEEGKPDTRSGTYLGYFTAGERGTKAGGGGDAAMSQGTFTYASKDIYVGEWQGGKKHGKGSYSYAKDGTKLIGDWVQGKIVSGEWIFPNGTFYSGKFRYNKPFGKGVWVFKNGNQLTGEYIQKEQPAEEEPPLDEDGNPLPGPDPKVWCRFQHGKNVAVRGGSMDVPK